MNICSRLLCSTSDESKTLECLLHHRDAGVASKTCKNENVKKTGSHDLTAAGGGVGGEMCFCEVDEDYTQDK